MYMHTFNINSDKKQYTIFRSVLGTLLVGYGFVG